MRRVGVLHWRLGAALLAHYLTPGVMLEQRAQLYVLLVQHLAQVKGAKVPAVGASTFRDDLDRARWSVRYVLSV
jgi:hypothetical protein